MPAPNELPADPLQSYTTNPVVARVHELLDKGALPLNPAFTVATDDEAELIYHDHRLLVCGYDQTYQHYADIMDRSDLPYIANNRALGTDEVVVGEIPRDARILSMLVRSVQPHNGEDVRDVFGILGHSLRQLIDRERVIPTAASLNLDRILVARKNLSVLLVPPVEFTPVTDTSIAELADALDKQLTPKYSRFGAAALLKSFQDGLGE